jgi:ASC-1-like (ASCH) protein
MKTYNEWDIDRMRTKIITTNNKFRTQLVENEWKRLESEEDVMKDEIYGTSDGLIKIVSPINRNRSSKCSWWGRIMKPSHNEIKVGDVISYDFDELFVGEGDDTSSWSLEGLKDEVLDTIKHTTLDKINTRVVVETRNKKEKR